MDARHSLLATLLAIGAGVATAGQLPTRLYVRTIPAGARVVLDGKELGLSDNLFIVLPGGHTVTIELEGHLPEKRDVKLPAERITRLVITMVKRQDPVGGDPAEPDGGGFEAAVAMLARARLPQALGEAMLTVVRQHPGESRWSGRQADSLFAIAAKRLPTGPIRQRATPALLELTHSLAVQELLKAKSLLDRYAAAGLDDATILRQAVVRAAGDLQVTGSVEGLTHQAAAQGNFAVAYVFAQEKSLTAHLLQPAELAKVQTAYREVMHAQARDLMARKNWKDALALWGHLHTRKLVSQALYLDAATCFVELKQPDDALKILQEAYAAFAVGASADWLEQCGDLACKVGQPGEALAVKAYKQASARLRNTVSANRRGKQ
jgi:hypothetical protein